MSIFISIASYQDPLLVATLFSAYNNAEHKKDLIFGVCDQSDSGIKAEDLPFAKQIHYEHIDPSASKGPCWARHRIQGSFNDEDYYLQIDSHTQFLERWDTQLIGALTDIESHSSNDSYFSKPIITSYPRSFEVNDFSKGLFDLNVGDTNTQVMVYKEDELFCRSSFSRQIGRPTELDRNTHAYLMAGGCIFTKGAFVRDIPYDPNYYFYGEEQSMALRAFTRGYSFFHIPDVPLFHLYTDVTNLPRKLHWDPEDDKNRVVKWTEREKKSLDRLDALFAGELDQEWGLGSDRSLDDYAKISGMDLKNKCILDMDQATTPKFFQSTDWKVNPLKI